MKTIGLKQVKKQLEAQNGNKWLLRGQGKAIIEGLSYQLEP